MRHHRTTPDRRQGGRELNNSTRSTSLDVRAHEGTRGRILITCNLYAFASHISLFVSSVRPSSDGPAVCRSPPVPLAVRTCARLSFQVAPLLPDFIASVANLIHFLGPDRLVFSVLEVCPVLPSSRLVTRRQGPCSRCVAWYKPRLC